LWSAALSQDIGAASKDREIVGREMVPMRWGILTWKKKPRKDAGDLQRARRDRFAGKPMLIGRPTSRNVEDNRQNSMFFPLPFHYGRLTALFSYNGRSDERNFYRPQRWIKVTRPISMAG
jgi:hypothetical protein